MQWFEGLKKLQNESHSDTTRVTRPTSWPLHAGQENVEMEKEVEEKECVRLKGKVRRAGNGNAEEDGGEKEVKDG